MAGTTEPLALVLRSVETSEEIASAVVVAFVVVALPVITKLPLMVEDAVERKPARVVAPVSDAPEIVGEVPNTAAPVPVSSVSAAIRFADEGVPRKVATFAPRPETPVEIGRPVALVSTAAEGVPRFGVVKTGLLANTSAPVPVSSVTSEASSAEVSIEEEPRRPWKTDQSAEVRKPLVEAEAAWPLV